MTLRRVVGDVDLYYVANARHAENRRLNRVTQDVWLTTTSPRAVPVVLDAWTGETRPVGLWERQADRVRVRVDLAPGQSTVIAFATPQSADPAQLHAIATTALDVLREPGKLVARAGTAGNYTVTLGDGRTVAAKVDRVRDPVVPSSWRLEVEDWQPGATATETVKPVRTAELTTLVPWSQIPGLEDVSGLGRYTHPGRPRLRLDRPRRRLARARRGHRHLPGHRQRRGGGRRATRCTRASTSPACCAAAPTSSRSRWPPPSSTGCARSRRPSTAWPSARRTASSDRSGWCRTSTSRSAADDGRGVRCPSATTSSSCCG